MSSFRLKVLPTCDDVDQTLPTKHDSANKILEPSLTTPSGPILQKRSNFCVHPLLTMPRTLCKEGTSSEEPLSAASFSAKGTLGVHTEKLGESSEA